LYLGNLNGDNDYPKEQEGIKQPFYKPNWQGERPMSKQIDDANSCVLPI